MFGYWPVQNGEISELHLLSSSHIFLDCCISSLFYLLLTNLSLNYFRWSTHSTYCNMGWMGRGQMARCALIVILFVCQISMDMSVVAYCYVYFEKLVMMVSRT